MRLFDGTFDEAVNRYIPANPELGLLEPWTSGGMVGKIKVTHHDDLPKVYGFLWRLHPAYRGPLTEGAFVLFPRYAYEVICEGSGLGEDGEPQTWQLAAINLETIEAIVQLELLEHPDDLAPEVIRANVLIESA